MRTRSEVNQKIDEIKQQIINERDGINNAYRISGIKPSEVWKNCLEAKLHILNWFLAI